MANDLHHSALILELLQLVLLDNFSFNFFYRHNGVLPTTPVHNSVATLRQLAIIGQLIEWNLVVLNEGSSFI